MGVTQIINVIYYTLRVLHNIANNLMAIPSYCIWYAVLFPLRKLWPELFWKIENVLFKAMMSFVVQWMRSGGYKLIESGDDLSSLENEKCLLLVNHQSTSDIPLVMSALYPKSLAIGQVMWIMDYIFVYTNFGWASYLHHDFFIQQGKEGRQDQLEKLKAHLVQYYNSTNKRWIVLFPEGGFLYKRRETSQNFAKKHDLPVLSHVTLPRLGALNTILNTVGATPTVNGFKEPFSRQQQSLKWVIDMTLAYPDSEGLDMPGMCIGWHKPRNMMVHFRAYPVSEIPLDTEGRTKWLYDRYVEKEHMLEQFYKNKQNLDDSDKQTRQLPLITRHEVPFDMISYLCAYGFYALSAYIFWLCFYCPVWMGFKYLVSCML